MYKRQRDDLSAKVTHLNEYEGSFRSSLTDYLRRPVADLEGQTFQPGEKPALLSGDGEHSTSATPRLDALLHEQG